MVAGPPIANQATALLLFHSGEDDPIRRFRDEATLAKKGRGGCIDSSTFSSSNFHEFDLHPFRTMVPIENHTRNRSLLSKFLSITSNSFRLLAVEDDTRGRLKSKKERE